ncbi:MAG: glyoxalase superfamily protein [Methylobacterium frigidaeris]
MRTHRDAKLMARTLAEELTRHNTPLPLGTCLDIVARQFGLANWNVLAARLEEKPASSPVPAPPPGPPMPAGWQVTGSKPHLYEAGIDAGMPHGAGAAAVIRSRFAPGDPQAADPGFATLMQSVRAEAFRGQRVSLRADLKTEAVSGAATLWLRIEGQPRQILAFDNMEERALDGVLTGTRDWVERRIVLDVPEAARTLHFGFYLRGGGKTWAGGFALEPATADVTAPVTSLPARPVNLDFTQASRATR